MSNCNRRRGKGGWPTLLLAAVIVAYTREFITIAAIAIAVYAAYKLLEMRQHSKDLKVVNDSWMSLKADHENMLANMGDPAGVYGDYEGVTMPMTTPYLRSYLNV